MENNNSRFSCCRSSCTFSCGSKQAILTHFRDVHSATCLFMCRSCKQRPWKIFKSEKRALKHIRSVHGNTAKPKFLVFISSSKELPYDLLENCKIKLSCMHSSCDLVTNDALQLRNHFLESHSEYHVDNSIECIVKVGTCQDAEMTDDYDGNERSLVEVKKEPDASINVESSICADMTNATYIGEHKYMEKFQADQYSVPVDQAFKGRLKQCPVCNQLRVNLSQHMKIHSGIKNFQCNSCDFKTCRKGDLLEHMIVHNDWKEFRCDVCSNSFKRRRDLRIHMKIHNETKNFKCQKCGRHFLLKHHLTYHETKSIKCKPEMALAPN